MHTEAGENSQSAVFMGSRHSALRAPAGNDGERMMGELAPPQNRWMQKKKGLTLF